MKISRLFEYIAKSKPGQKFYNWCTKPKSEYFLNNTLPQIETVLSTSCYVWSTARRKEIDKDQRDLLQIQNVGSGVVGLLISSWANRKVGKLGEDIITHLDTQVIDPKSIRKITNGLRVGLPIVTTAFCMRFLIPSVLAAFSGKMMDKIREKRDNKQYTDILQQKGNIDIEA